MKISYSSFDTFTRCPFQYKLSYIDRVKTREKPELYFGSLIHEIVQFTLKKDPILPSFNDLEGMLKNNWREDVFTSSDEAAQYFDFGLEMLKKFYADWKPGLRNIVATEKRFFIPLNEKHNLSGMIDRVDKLPFGAYEIIDYKTSKALPSQIDVDRDKQLSSYRLAVESLWPEVSDVRLTLYYLKHNQKITTTRRPDEVEEIKNELISTADKIEIEKDFPAKKNALCNWCDFKDRCPLFSDSSLKTDEKSAAETQAIPIDDVLDEYLELHEKMLKLELQLHAHFDSQKIASINHKNTKITRSLNRKLNIE